jgi:hypothetical protein
VVVRELPARYLEDSAVILADPDDAAAGLPSWLCNRLAQMEDWVVESDGEVVLIYRHEWVVSPAALHDFLETVRGIARLLVSPHPSK